ncbi:uncharacterized protein PG986_001162 [Apiospora aurea]|uniref:Rhodopsin domain-containing protein n=1 Tax=Apiospora aurea TaxID=335848 RepID=A0ABR1QXT2_9PEZI
MPPGPVGAIPPPPGVTPNFENPEDILNTINLASQILSIVVMTVFLALRVYVKTKVAPPFLLDDFYGPNAWFTKFALLLVIARVFRSFRATRISAWVIIILMLCYYVPVFIIKVQVCRPINAYWDLSIKGVDLVSQRAPLRRRYRHEHRLRHRRPYPSHPSHCLAEDTPSAKAEDLEHVGFGRACDDG